MKFTIYATLFCIFIGHTAQAREARYQHIAKHNKEYALSQSEMGKAKMQGECLVQLKELTFKKKNEFDPISEWINYRSVPLLENYSPCEVLLMLEVANQQLRNNQTAEVTTPHAH